MRLLHGSNVEIKVPDLNECQSMNDFGRGFYLTPQWQRAYMMAKRKAARDGGNTVVNPFMFYPEIPMPYSTLQSMYRSSEVSTCSIASAHRRH